MIHMDTPTKNLASVKQEIKQAAKLYGLKKPPEPTIIAISKTHEKEKILPLLESGHRIFGENRVQEAKEKWPELKKQYPGIELHLVGPLQTNKVKEAIAIFDVIQSLDREKLARSIAAEMEKSGKWPELFIQINTGEEEQKAGLTPKQAGAFIKFCTQELKLNISGLMCIPPAHEEPSPHFALLKKIAEENEIVHLSMGMSADFTLAAALGATHVRVGSAIFGKR